MLPDIMFVPAYAHTTAATIHTSGQPKGQGTHMHMPRGSSHARAQLCHARSDAQSDEGHCCSDSSTIQAGKVKARAQLVQLLDAFTSKLQISMLQTRYIGHGHRLHLLARHGSVLSC